MSGRPSWLRADLVVAVVVVIVIFIAVASPRWRSMGRTASPRAGHGSAADTARSHDNTSDVAPATPAAIGAPRELRHRSPFDGAATTRAESICVNRVEANLQSQLGEPYVARVTDRYGVGDMDTGAGDSLDFDGTARSASGRLRIWHCGMANLGAYPGGPMITHSEGQ